MGHRRRWYASLALALVMALGAIGSGAAAPSAAKGENENHGKSDSLKHPLGASQQSARQKAQEMVLKGQATPQGKNKVVKVPKGQFVELAREGEDSIWTVLAEFGNQVNPTYGGAAGPLHNQIPQPDRSVDN
ncbi:MAG TPA: hypothetical protein VFT99_22755, partial [Roseiflexaceae bacterium]|nr:hypothetical protein [Roseiflexaceae bacterium]